MQALSLFSRFGELDTMINKADIPIFIPAFNEEQAIGEVLQAIRQCGYIQLYVVDDGSSDDTAEKARQADAAVIRHEINRGAGAATQTAIDWAREAGHTYMVLMDADGQHLPQDIEVLVQQISMSDCDIVIGSRFLGDVSAMPNTRRWLNRAANLLTNLFCKYRYTDTQSGFRMLNRRAIENLHLTLDEFGFCSEMLVLAEQNDLKIAEVPIEVIYTPYSQAKGQDLYNGIGTALNFLWKIIFK